MITCVLRYVIVPSKLAEFELYAKVWIDLVNRFGGEHHGYFLPCEGASDIALALFSFGSLAEYERYRAASFLDADCLDAYQFAEQSECIVRYERTFYRPLTPGARSGLPSSPR